MINSVLVGFSQEEIHGRIKKLQLELDNNNLVGAILSAESNLNYYSNFHTHAPWTTFTRPSFLFVPVSGAPVLYTQVFLTPEAKAISKACDVRNFDSLLGPTEVEIIEILTELNMDRGKIGFEFGFEQRIGFEVNTLLALRDRLNQTEFIDISDIIWKQRIIKSEKEIECHRRACAATSYSHDKIFGVIEKGMTEIEVSRRVQQFMLEGGAEYPGFVIITSGKGNYCRISKTASNRKLEDGDMLWLDLGARYNGYWSDFCRAGIVGEIDEYRNNLQNRIHDITMEAAQIMKPGVLVSEVANMCAKGLQKHGFDASFECGRMGHGMGLMSTEPPSITIYDKTILQEGMIINLEPGVVNEAGVFDIEENFVITKSGFECLSGGSRKLHRIK